MRPTTACWNAQAARQGTAGPWKYPRWIEVRADLPRTATGKIQRFKLRDEEVQSPI